MFSNRKREEVRNEGVIRSLLKLQENRRCINCNSLGPQYVCTTFWTFVCTSCSGVHRGFSHRVKSVSMAKFNAEEVSALQAGGNERARQIYFKEWHPQCHSFPDSSNQNKLRDFIKHVYVDRKFTGERSMGRLAMVKGDAGEDSSERRSIERPSPRERTLKYYIDERSPRNKLNNVRSFSHRNRPVNFEIVDDRFRDDGFGSCRRSESHRPFNAESRKGNRSPVSQKRREMITPLVVHPARDSLGENGPYLQKAASFTVPGSVDGKSLKYKRVTSGSLIDFISDPKPPDHGAATQQTALSINGGNGASVQSSTKVKSSDVGAATQQTALSINDGNGASVQSSAKVKASDDGAVTKHGAATQQTALSINDGNGASVQSSTRVKACDEPNINSLESILFQLSAPAAGPVDNMSAAPGNAGALSAAPVELSNSVGAVVTESTTNIPAAPCTRDAPAASPVGIAQLLPNKSDSMVKVTDGQQLPIMKSNQPYSSLSGDSNSATQHTTSSVGALYNQLGTSSLAPNAQGPSSASAEESSQASSKVAQDNTTGVGLQALQVEAKPSRRNELPADLFTSSFSPFTAPVPSWQIHPPHGMGYSMQYYPNAVPVPAFLNSSKSTNPFDLDDDSTQAQVSMFPPMLPWHGASDIHSSQLMQPQASPYASTVSPQFPSYGTSMSPSAFTGQQLPNNMPFSGPQEISCVGGGEAAFASLNPIQQSSSRFPAPTTSNPFSSTGGNPFG